MTELWLAHSLTATVYRGLIDNEDSQRAGGAPQCCQFFILSLSFFPKKSLIAGKKSLA